MTRGGAKASSGTSARNSSRQPRTSRRNVYLGIESTVLSLPRPTNYGGTISPDRFIPADTPRGFVVAEGTPIMEDDEVLPACPRGAAAALDAYEE
ncbi:BQ5605_C001g00938 [Microbotryum silenes-dioicae]|uniref:BQ5605_C001g00938 protein n=1 Tax=Microbotryum silenes-dioicae TaxID=796604 RepID=A0A2X0M912_9BASI|nr:BQ5605_C001g00938 [Microbotryum silenes-dioicae]